MRIQVHISHMMMFGVAMTETLMTYGFVIAIGPVSIDMDWER
jgi:F0F1-type ATP synthase membrane subunit c/vacuolar-type H+-ATPase subunit K